MGNCFLIALWEKIKNPKNKIYLIKPWFNPGGHLHFMWKDADGRNFHFTSHNQLHGLKILLFKGYIEELKIGTIERFNGVKII